MLSIIGANHAEEALPALAPGASSQAEPEATSEGAADADGAGGDAAWLAEPPEGFHSELSSFGHLFSLVDGWVTTNSLAFLAGEAPEPASSSAGDSLAAEARRLPAARLPCLSSGDGACFCAAWMLRVFSLVRCDVCLLGRVSLQACL